MIWANRLVTALAVWRLSNMLVNEDGPGDVFDGLRRIANRGPLAGLFSCVYCMSVWISAAAHFRPLRAPRRSIEDTLAGSALAILIHEGLNLIKSVSSDED